jgi:hypothetical protein
MKKMHVSQQIIHMGTSRRVNNHWQHVCYRIVYSVCRSDTQGGSCYSSVEDSIDFAALDTEYLVDEREWNARRVPLAQKPTYVEELLAEKCCGCKKPDPAAWI